MSSDPSSLAAAPSAVLSADAADPDLMALEASASAGRSVAARVLVNAREATADLAISAARAPNAALRRRVIAAARPSAAPRRDAHATTLNPSTAVGRLHLLGDGEAHRRETIDALGSFDLERCGRVLAEVHGLIRFPVLFVALVLGDRVENRVRYGVPPELEAVLANVDRESTFCTHCVSADAPLVVENAATEPFFRGSQMARELGVRAYVGVPLRIARGQTIGTVCALDVTARPVPGPDVRVLELFSQVVAAELEHRRTPELRRALREASQSGHDVYARSWFEQLLDIEVTRASNGYASTLLGVEGVMPHELIPCLRPGEVVGRLNDRTLGVLLAGSLATRDATSRQADTRRDGLMSAVPRGANVRWATADASLTGAAWRDIVTAR